MGTLSRDTGQRLDGSGATCIKRQASLLTACRVSSGGVPLSPPTLPTLRQLLGQALQLPARCVLTPCCIGAASSGSAANAGGSRFLAMVRQGETQDSHPFVYLQ